MKNKPQSIKLIIFFQIVYEMPNPMSNPKPNPNPNRKCFNNT